MHVCMYNIVYYINTCIYSRIHLFAYSYLISAQEISSDDRLGIFHQILLLISFQASRQLLVALCALKTHLLSTIMLFEAILYKQENIDQ